MKRLLNRRGSALIWAMAVICVLFIAAAGILTLSMSYYNRSLSVAARANATLTARSAIEFVSADVIGGGEEFKPDTGNETAETFEFEINPCTITVRRDSDEELHIRAVSEYIGGSCVLNAVMECVYSYDEEGTPIENWFFTGYLDK